MERQPLLPSSATTNLPPQEDEISSFTVPETINEEHEHPFHDLVSSSSTGFTPSISRSKTCLHRSRTAPAMAVMQDLKHHSPQLEKPKFESNSIIRQAFFLLLFYLSLGVVVYSFNRDNFSGIETHPVVDALYFCIVTMCTIGYGDIAPTTPATKIFACVFVLVGFGFIDILLSGVVNYVLDLQENMIMTSVQMGGGLYAKNYIFDAEKGRMRIRMKVGLALGVVVLCIGTGTMILYFVENLDWVDSVYLSVMSVTTVGYGDRAFKTLQGRLFAAVWLLFSTLAVARAFLYLAEARIDKRHRRITKWVLHREITVDDLLAADVNNNGFISKSEYVLYKLKEMGKISEKDMLQICDQFNKLDLNNSGKITLPDILESRGSPEREGQSRKSSMEVWSRWTNFSHSNVRRKKTINCCMNTFQSIIVERSNKMGHLKCSFIFRFLNDKRFLEAPKGLKKIRPGPRRELQCLSYLHQPNRAPCDQVWLLVLELFPTCTAQLVVIADTANLKQQFANCYRDS